MNDTEKENKSDEDSESLEEEEVDPRVQGELEKLNQSTDNINRWETELEDSRQKFRAVLLEATVKLDEQVKKIGKAVEDSKPYWEARKAARQAQVEAQRATQEYQRAMEILRAAKETIALAEERLLEEDSRQFDSAWQEMLNHATQRVMEAEQTRTRSELEHRETATKYNAAINHMRQLEKKLKRTINKSRPYFELKAKYYLQLEQLKRRVDERQAKLTQAKAEYRTALRNLETISDEIHARRRLSAMGPRGRGVGAEDDGAAADDIANFKMESDGISMMSVNLEDSGTGTTSEDDPETQSTGSLSSTSAALDLPCPFPSSSSPYALLSSSCPYPSSPCAGPELLQLPGSGSLEGFEQESPVLGPRSECSGASSPDCEQERGERAEGAEVKPDRTNNISRQKSSRLEKSLRSLSLQTADDDDTDTRSFTVTSNTPAVLLLNSV
ncbi:SH3 domain-binding protein 5 [Pimephales promelas]|uniref:SH3 domain-binding protein 5 n=1 Tax=Pimephales promelas TaxID=90988 RepID=UPI001955C1AC|nr:SH3 domain-binding protein 5 [Pimephales promelas]KAG1948353.1 SH3 domain-binding protein [Pimephales promelas]